MLADSAEVEAMEFRGIETGRFRRDPRQSDEDPLASHGPS
jgi:hypothetical protein